MLAPEQGDACPALTCDDVCDSDGLKCVDALQTALTTTTVTVAAGPADDGWDVQ